MEVINKDKPVEVFNDDPDEHVEDEEADEQEEGDEVKQPPLVVVPLRLKKSAKTSRVKFFVCQRSIIKYHLETFKVIEMYD